jgi:hypothetical protein
LANHFSGLFVTEALAAIASDDVRDDIYAVTILREGSYMAILLRNHNIVLTLAVLVGAVMAVLNRHRWDIIWCVTIGVFLLVMAMADRPGIERYLFPILPAMWLMAARAVFGVAGNRSLVIALGFGMIVAMPLYALVKQNYTWTRPDTRVMAKNWIETNVAPGAKILMDGMRYRFIFSPPLNPDEATVARRLSSAEDEDGQISRGISGRTMSLYAKAMAAKDGPKYDLHSTVWGLEVRELSRYPEECFDFIVTSSGIANRFRVPDIAERYPESVVFYRELPSHPGFTQVYSVQPIPWKIQGPAIDVYEVQSACK